MVISGDVAVKAVQSQSKSNGKKNRITIPALVFTLFDSSHGAVCVSTVDYSHTRIGFAIYLVVLVTALTFRPRCT